MTTYNIIRSVIAGLTATLIVSCDQLGPVEDIAPENVLTSENVFADKSTTEAVTNGMYKLWRSDGFTQMRNAMFLLTQTSRNSSVGQAYEFKINEVSQSSTNVLFYYQDLYKLINQANTIICLLPSAEPQKLNADRKKEIVGEAYFCRALANFMLLRSFGEFWNVESKYGIVLYDEPVMSNEGKARSSVKECYSLILSDLDEAAKLAPAYDGVSYRATSLAAKALKARVQLYLNDFSAAKQLADEVIAESNANGVCLEEDYSEIFINSFDSKEMLFSVYTEYPRETIYVGLYNDFYFNGVGPTLERISDELVGTADDGDIATGQGYDSRFLKTFAFEDEEGETKASIAKYPNNIDNEDVNTYYFLRLAEIYLIKAEAEARLGNMAESRKALKAITDRAGYEENYVSSISDSDMLLSILKHKFVELNAENYEEWFDMVRYNQLDGTDFEQLGFVRSFRHKNLPIPYDALAGNARLEQNADYKPKIRN